MTRLGLFDRGTLVTVVEAERVASVVVHSGDAYIYTTVHDDISEAAIAEAGVQAVYYKASSPPLLISGGISIEDRDAAYERCAQVAENELDGSHEGNARAAQIAGLIRAMQSGPVKS